MAQRTKKTSKQSEWPANAVFTVGHSTLPIEDFVALLQAYGIGCVDDIRTIPRSRHNPQFEGAALEQSLIEQHIGYEHIAALGGLRRARKDSMNGGWRNASFRGYADYMQTEEFNDAVEALVKKSRKARIALMCAEAVPWRCHRSLVADALTVRGVSAVEILSGANWRIHKLTPFAHVEGTRITYPPEGDAE